MTNLKIPAELPYLAQWPPEAILAEDKARLISNLVSSVAAIQSSSAPQNLNIVLKWYIFANLQRVTKRALGVVKRK